MGTSSFNKELLYAAAKLNYASNMADCIKLETLRELVPLLLMEQSLIQAKENAYWEAENKTKRAGRPQR